MMVRRLFVACGRSPTNRGNDFVESKDHLFLPWFLHGFKLAMYAALTPRRCVLLEYAFHLQHLSRKAWKNNEHNKMAFVFI